MHAEIYVEYCVDTNLITDYGVFCGINAGLFNWNETGLCVGYTTVVDGIRQVSSLQKGEECSVCGDSSTILDQTLLLSIILALEIRGAAFERPSRN